MNKQQVYYGMILIIVAFQIASALDPLAIVPLKKYPEKFCNLVKELAPPDYQRAFNLFADRNSLEERVPKRLLFWGDSGVGKTTAFEVLAQCSGRPSILINAGKLGGNSQNAVDNDLKEIFAQLPPGSLVGFDNFGRIVHQSQNNGADVAAQVWEFMDSLERAGHKFVALMNGIGVIDESLQTRFVGNAILFAKQTNIENIKKALLYHLGSAHQCENKQIHDIAAGCRNFSNREIQKVAEESHVSAYLRKSPIAPNDLNQALKKVQENRDSLANKESVWDKFWRYEGYVFKGLKYKEIGGAALSGLVFVWKKLPFVKEAVPAAASTVTIPVFTKPLSLIDISGSTFPTSAQILEGIMRHINRPL